MLKWLKKPYESHFVERKNFIIEYRVNIISETAN